MRTITFGKPLIRLITLVAICMLSLHAMAYNFPYTHQGTTLGYTITSSNTVKVASFSYTYQGTTLGYTITSSNTVKVADDNSVSGDVVIPSSVTNNGTTYSVTSIGYHAFYGCSGLTSVTIPNSVTSISNSAFYGCSGLTSVTIPNSVTSIGYEAFRGCSGLTSVTIGNGVTSIGEGAFCNCSGLTSVTIPNSVTSIGEDAFWNCSGLTSVTIPNSVTSIGEWAFCACSSLTSVTIPNSVTSIADYVFVNCSGLTSITIPNSVTSIGNEAFAGCSGLTSITIPNSVTSIGNEAFYGCIELTSVTIPNSVTSIGDSAFYYCNGLTSVTLPNNATISSKAFMGAGAKTTIDSVIYCSDTLIVGNYTFIGTGFLTFYLNGNSYFSNNNAVVFDCYASKSGNLIIPSTISYNGTTYSVTSIGEGAFAWCNGLTSVTIPNSVTSIGDRAFYYCSGLTSVTIPNSVTSIGNSAFLRCSSLTSVSIPNSVTSIGGAVFYDCSGLTSVTIPNSVTSIGGAAFYDCSGLISVTIPNSVTSIGDYAFQNCSSLTSVTIPNSVTSIGDYAFQNCSGLISVTIGNSVTSIGDGAFSFCSGLTSVTIGNSVTSIGNYAFYECSELTSVTIPNSVTSIGEGVFYDCSGLTSIVSKATVPPAIGNAVFPYPNTCNVTIPCGSLEAYIASSWNNYFPNRITEVLSFDLSVAANDDSFGSVSVVETQSCNVITLIATPSSCKSFVAWNDGNTDNPRTVTITSDTSFTAIFESVISNDITAAICQGETYTENGFNVSEAGVYTQNLQTANGCDSTVTLTLVVNPVATTNLNAAICQGETYTENGFNVSEAGVYTQNLQTINGCDSVVTLTLTVNPVYSFTIDATINQGETYHGNGFEVSEAGTYTQNLQTVNGCDSVIVLNLTVNSSLGDVVANTIEVALYPNPAENYTVLKVQGLKEQTKVALFDVRGRKLREFDLAAGTESVRLDLRDLPSGVYTLMIGNTTKKLIVE